MEGAKPYSSQSTATVSRFVMERAPCWKIAPRIRVVTRRELGGALTGLEGVEGRPSCPVFAPLASPWGSASLGKPVAPGAAQSRGMMPKKASASAGMGQLNPGARTHLMNSIGVIIGTPKGFFNVSKSRSLVTMAKAFAPSAAAR